MPTASMTKTDKTPRLNDAYALQTPADNQRLYADWADSYDTSFAAEMDYLLPAHVAQAYVALGGAGPVLDIGAGTGLAGQALAALGTGPIDATDLSAEMLTVAMRKGVYRASLTADLLQGLPCADASYQGAISSGTFTHGHVGPDALDELLRVTAPGGLIVISVNAQHWQAQGFEAKFAALAGAITPPDLPRHAIYGPANTSDHRHDQAIIASFRKL